MRSAPPGRRRCRPKRLLGPTRRWRSRSPARRSPRASPARSRTPRGPRAGSCAPDPPPGMARPRRSAPIAKTTTVAAGPKPSSNGAAMIAGAAIISIAAWAERGMAREGMAREAAMTNFKIRTYVRSVCDRGHTWSSRCSCVQTPSAGEADAIALAVAPGVLGGAACSSRIRMYPTPS